MRRITFTTSDYNTDETVTLRTSVDAWSHDIEGTYSYGSWRYDLAEIKYEDGFDFKFRLPRYGVWCGGANLVAATGATDVDVDGGSVRFCFTITFAPGDYLAFWHSYLLRTSLGWDTDVAPNSADQHPVWILDWARYRTACEAKFVLADGPDGPDYPVWMLGNNLQLTPEPGRHYTYSAQHNGPIEFPFFVRLVGDEYVNSTITVRDQANSWGDRHGWFDGTGWSFPIPWTDYHNSSQGGPSAIRYKFAKDGQPMTGANLQIGPDTTHEPGRYPEAGQTYDTPAGSVTF